MPIGRAIKRPRLFNWAIVGENTTNIHKFCQNLPHLSQCLQENDPFSGHLKAIWHAPVPHPKKWPNYRLSDMVFILISNAIACWSFWKVSVWLHFWENANGLLQNPWLTSVYKLAGRMDLSAVLSFTDFTGLLPVFVADLSFFPATHRSLSAAESSLDVKLEPIFIQGLGIKWIGEPKVV